MGCPCNKKVTGKFGVIEILWPESEEFIPQRYVHISLL